MLHGRVLEYVDISEAELRLYLDRLGVKGGGGAGRRVWLINRNSGPD
jgi:hypothetical protein